MEIKKCHSCGMDNSVNTTRCKGCGWNLIGSQVYSAGQSNNRTRSGPNRRTKLVLFSCIGVVIIAAITGALYLKRKRSRELEASLKTAIALKPSLTINLPKEIYRRSVDPARNRGEGLLVPVAARVLERAGFITVDTLLTIRSRRPILIPICRPFANGCDTGPTMATGIPDAVYDIKVKLTPKGEILAKEWEYVENIEYKEIVRTGYTGPEMSSDDGNDEIRGKWIVPVAEREFVAISSIPAYAFASDEFSIEFLWRWKVKPYVKGLECDKPEMDNRYNDASLIHIHKTNGGTANFVRTNGRWEAVNVSFKEDQ